MKRKNEEMQWKSEEKIIAIRTENEKDEKEVVKGGPYVGPSNPIGKSFIHPTSPKTTKEPRAIYTQETEGECYLNRSIPTTSTLDVSCRHPFTDHIMGAQLPAVRKGFNMDRYDGMTDPMSTWTCTPYT